ncbi:flagellar protein FlaG [Gallaecimonas sp. GXIMD4217]|uniref:flagellar protein FlaG n=1 Tax=Gallaecimonas sp. GXIMD4217 TaxID=3131927 RepID=UPI00311AD238
MVNVNANSELLGSMSAAGSRVAEQQPAIEQARAVSSKDSTAGAVKPESVEEDVVRESLESAMEAVKRFVDANKRGLDFSVDDAAERTVVKVMDTNNNELVRQIPSDEILSLAARIRVWENELSEKIGILFDSQV